MKLNPIKNLSKLAVGVVCSFGIAGLLAPSEARAASVITNVTPSGSLVEPASYNVFLDAGDPLPVTVQVTVPTTPQKLDLFLLEDLSGSFGDDLFTVQSLVPSLTSSITSLVSDTQFGVGSFVDKPIGPFGGLPDYVYRTDLSLTSDTTLLQSTIDGLSILGGGDTPESQLEALLQTAVRANSEVGFRNDAFKVVVLSTDAEFHQAGDFSSQPPNNGDAVLDGSPEGTGEDYPSILQVKDLLAATNIIPIFAVTSDVVSTYEDLVNQLGVGSVVLLSSDSSNLVSAINAGLADIFRDITLTPVSDDYGYVQSIVPPSFTDVPEGDSRTFTVTLLADGVGDADDTLSLVAAGFGQTDVNVTVGKSVPEPSAMLGLLAFSAFGATSVLKRKQQQKATVKA
ncbi:PEP-CTERM sorting domain-containing protein [Nostoc sp. UHCC 0702]|nr:PEP-CTERM sorting domain-containing protein [Nostoc sp. UHCC 0702]